MLHTRLEDAEVVGNNGEPEVGGVGDVDDAGRAGDEAAVGNESTGLPLHMGLGEAGI